MKTAFFQSFEDPSEREETPYRLSTVQEELTKNKLSGYVVPHSDVHQGEYIAACDERLAWLTGFTGSAGICFVGKEKAGIFVDGRYGIQAKKQTKPPFEIIHWNKQNILQWIKKNIMKGKIGFDPWLHSYTEIVTLRDAFANSGISLIPSDNLIDRVWSDRPAKVSKQAISYPVKLAGLSAKDKCRQITKVMELKEADSAVITLPDSIAWLLNLRGNDVSHNPIVHAFLIIHSKGNIELFCKNNLIINNISILESFIKVSPLENFAISLSKLKGSVLVDYATVPFAAATILQNNGGKIILGEDPIILPKACKNKVELENARICHKRDAIHMCEFLSWIDRQDENEIDEIDVVIELENIRRKDKNLKEISFDTIAASGPNAALPHYRVNYSSNRKIKKGDVLLVDSGGQYLDGTTDITRTIAIGKQSEDVKNAFTRVLKGLISISMLKFPSGTSGRDIDAFARASLWQLGQDYAHGTGHGVGHYLSVHEGPQRISKFSSVEFKEGMIISNEPGFYEEGRFGIRIENLILVQTSKVGFNNSFLEFETLTFVPIDSRLISINLLDNNEREWINNYHNQCWQRAKDQVTVPTRAWLKTMTKPL
ncbi:aminopeptidase P family protein [Paracoccaceae bacterium]|nr:aminopeptidase P family protein [Paracoccaceae bacterium]